MGPDPTEALVFIVAFLATMGTLLWLLTYLEHQLNPGGQAPSAEDGD